jgi:hypothetical protein
VRFFVGITDRDWFDFLSRMDGLDEVKLLAAQWAATVPCPPDRRTLPLQAPQPSRLHRRRRVLQPLHDLGRQHRLAGFRGKERGAD